MPLAKNVMRGGVSAGAARALNGNEVQSALTAAGTTQGAAVAMEGDVNVISTATTGQGGVLSSQSVPGDEQIVYNSTSVDILVYPPVGGNFNQLAANTGFVLAPYTAVKCKKVTSTQWVGFLSA